MNTAKCVTCHLPGAGSSSSPCSDTYAGSAAFSEVENRNIRDFITTIASKTNVAITIHSYSQLWLIPWGSYSYKPSDYNELVCAFHFEKKSDSIGKSLHGNPIATSMARVCRHTCRISAEFTEPWNNSKQKHSKNQRRKSSKGKQMPNFISF
jgi:hypothetical protein